MDLSFKCLHTEQHMQGVKTNQEVLETSGYTVTCLFPPIFKLPSGREKSNSCQTYMEEKHRGLVKQSGEKYVFKWQLAFFFLNMRTNTRKKSCIENESGTIPETSQGLWDF